MQREKALLAINPRAGQNVTKIPDVVSVLSAAGWETEVALKQYGGQSIEMAREASEDGHDLVIGYGGDGTVNQVVNGIMRAKKPGKSVVGVIPGGTANLWAGDIGVPTEPVKAALALVNSEVRRVDVGRVEVASVSFPENIETQRATQNGKKAKKRARKQVGSRVRNHFLLMAGLGFDAEVMRHAPKPLKYRLGPLAVGLTVAQKLPDHQTFPIEIRGVGESGESDMIWQGEALQVIIGNTRRYAMVLETTPEAYIDDGVLDVCIIVGGDPVSTMQQVGSLLLRHKPHNTTSQYFHGSHLEIKVPASVPMELDGSAVKLKDYVSKEDYELIGQVEDFSQVMVSYRFDALHKALPMAFPCTYNEELFQHPQRHKKLNLEQEEEHKASNIGDKKKDDTAQTELQVATERAISQPEHSVDVEKEKRQEEIRAELPSLVPSLFENGRKVTVIGKAQHPEKPGTYIVAGTTLNALTSEQKPAAVVIGNNTEVFGQHGQHIPSSAVADIQEGTTIVVEGKRSKLGVIKATRVVL